MVKKKNIGIKVKQKGKDCKDKKCPFHGSVKIRGRIIKGIIVATDVHKSATMEITRRQYIPKYERYEKRRSRIRLHNPVCINAQKGDLVRVGECRRLSKTKNFVIIEVIGKDVLFKQREEALEEAKVKEKKKEEKKEENASNKSKEN